MANKQISATRVSAPKSLIVVVNRNIFFSCKLNIFLQLRRVSSRYNNHKKFCLMSKALTRTILSKLPFHDWPGIICLTFKGDKTRHWWPTLAVIWWETYIIWRTRIVCFKSNLLLSIKMYNTSLLHKYN